MDFERARHQSETHRNVKPRQFISLIVLNDFSVSLSSRKIKRQMVPLQVATHCTLFPCSMDMRCILRASIEHARRVHDHCGARQRALKLGCAHRRGARSASASTTICGPQGPADCARGAVNTFWEIHVIIRVYHKEATMYHASTCPMSRVRSLRKRQLSNCNTHSASPPPPSDHR